ncbi:hypothetical protein EMIHUDRAFT_202818 [Emiliania huxleyi CCMP1516]|uniref:Uncharacterized protein n=2 Tax=Emiliania huxleyi TaxID=2903 RepID=A0A0D3K8V3_EMIH1|nr:hypothetical protein EMIHUDRAFT_202818 [Emiliania huxleyi CCMP1516]EOD32188.1 hypothetical protein EMIHUDRAFT_202818 [Emiliania huxleyi CCMP1516]|eukprot:XP_005784617.1 hypothetical protein EMIHUDRAFT_202818 [Emiliania huxleyi CCMP1516]
MPLIRREYQETATFIVQSIGKLVVGSEIGGTGQKRKDYSKKQSRAERRATGATDQAQQRKEVLAGTVVLAVLLFFALYGLWATIQGNEPKRTRRSREVLRE